MSSPVKLAGPGSHSTSPRSSTSLGSRAPDFAQGSPGAAAADGPQSCAERIARPAGPRDADHRRSRPGPGALASAADGLPLGHWTFRRSSESAAAFFRSHCAILVRWSEGWQTPPAGTRGQHGNRLGSETSPYLLQHQDNPVHWRAWGQRPRPRPSARESPSCSRSATPPAIGATSWRMRASRTTGPPR